MIKELQAALEKALRLRDKYADEEDAYKEFMYEAGRCAALVEAIRIVRDHG